MCSGPNMSMSAIREAWSGRLRNIGVALLLHLVPSLLVLGLGALSVWAFARFPPKQRNLWADEHQAKSS